ncbi:O-antigen ligase family protein [Taibaiella soli]|uniref:O-antigen ligase family protein n=1 Tax=Taibaiella soli TaxID=1649169 RepID=UPI001403FFA8|nr:O-antigen ligase family protein [Taibaiella soli]
MAFAISMPFIYGSISVIFVALAWIVSGDFPQKLRRLISFGAIVWILYYILHAISYAYSTDKGESAFDLQSKMSFVLLPLCIVAGDQLNGEKLEKIFLSYVLGITASAIYCMGKAVFLYRHTHNVNYFFYHTLVKGLETNAVYIAWFAILSLFMLLFFNWSKFFKGKNAIWRWLLFALQMVFFILLSSRLLIVLFFVLIIPAGYAVYFKVKKISFFKMAVAVVTIVAIAISIFFTGNPINQRYKDIEKNNFSQLFKSDYTDKTLEFNNLTIRVFVWRVALQNIKEKDLWLTGCGNGSVHDIQNKKMKDLGLSAFQKPHPETALYNMNLHNMYLQSLLMLGIPGLLCFLAIVIVPFFCFKKIENKTVFVLFQIVSALFMLQEAALQTQAGIIYFTFFSQIFWNLYYPTVKNRSKLARINSM